MPQPTELSVILERIANGEHTEADLQTLRDLLNQGNRPPLVLQVGKYSVNIQQALGQVHIGDRLELTEENIQAIAQAIRTEIGNLAPSQSTEVASVDELVQQVRSRLHDDIQRLHGTTPLWGVDHWVPLGELFVDVNILEEVSSNRRSELADLWQDFSQNPSYRGLDRMGLGRERLRVSGLKVLDRNTNLMVVGKPGSGKTTYLQRVVTECNAGNLQAQRIPVLIRLREFGEDGREVGYSVDRYLERCWRLSAQAVRLVLGEGRSLVLLDGLDEVTGADGQEIAKQIKRFARVYPQVQMIVTCRTQSQESRFERFDYVEVADFNEPQVRAFVEHWFQMVCEDLTAGQAKTTEFREQLFREENKPIRELVTTPILLSLACAVFQQTGKFYSKRSKLYEEGLELLLEQWNRTQKIEQDDIYRDLSMEQKLKLLSYLAVKKFEQEQYVLFEQAEIEEYITDFLKVDKWKSRAILSTIESQYGLLIERSRNVWSFSHLTLQEYLVAQHFRNQLNWPKLLVNIANKHWREVFLIILEETKEPIKLLHLIKKNIDRIILNQPDLIILLNWTNRKTSSIHTRCKPAAVRAFYFSRISSKAISHEMFDDKFDIHLSSKIDSNFYRHDFLKKTLFSETLRKKVVFDDGSIELAYDFSNAINSEEIALDRCLYDTLDYVNTIVIHISIFYDHSDEYFYLHKNENEIDILGSILSPQYVTYELFCSRLSLAITYSSNLKLEEPLKELRKQLPKANVNRESFLIWWKENFLSWTISFQDTIIKYRDIGHNLKFTENQKELLQQYYDANEVLIDCLNHHSYFSDQEREEIEETLFLSIAEIEKRNC